MRIHYASDLHAEFCSTWRKLQHDLREDEDLILPGDVGCIEDGTWEEAVRYFSPQVRHLYLVLGNHELWSYEGTDAATLKRRAHAVAASMPNVTLLDCASATTPEGLQIVGVPLWTDPVRDPTAAWSIRTAVRDFRNVYTAHGPLDLATASRWHSEQVAWLRDCLARLDAEAPLLVATHFAPTPACNPGLHAGSELESYFCNDLSLDLLEHANVWIYGHVHGGAAEVRVGDTRLLRHCVGYDDDADSRRDIGSFEL